MMVVTFRSDSGEQQFEQAMQDQSVPCERGIMPGVLVLLGRPVNLEDLLQDCGGEIRDAFNAD